MSPGIELGTYRAKGRALINYATLAAGSWWFMGGSEAHRGLIVSYFSVIFVSG